MRGFRRGFGATLVAVSMLVGITGQGVRANHAGGTDFFDLAKMPAPDYATKGDEMFDALKSYVSAHTYRVTGTPQEITAGKYLHDEMASLGYEARTVTLGQNTIVADRPDAIGAGLKVVMGIKRGTTLPDEWIMFIGHYDSVPQTIYGAYDNGAGTNFIRYLAHEFKDVPTNRSLVFAFYNGEEQGLLASARHAAALQAQQQKIAAVLGFDMVGISYPVAPSVEGVNSCLCIWWGSGHANRFRPVLEHVNYEFLGFPQATTKVWLAGNNTRNSDEQSFNSRGYPTLRWAGKRTAASYSGYHNTNDTIERIIEEAGGEEYYERGLENTLKSVYYTGLALDNHVPESAFTVTRSGASIQVDGTGSSDPDGAISRFSWDFGDGTTAEGPTATHTFGAPGTYEVTLTVADNLHPQVTRSTVLEVTIG